MISINKKEVDKFSQMASEWWDPNGKFKPLHKFNPIRIKYIKENFKYVGENFAYEARSIHYNPKKKSKGIYGNASKKDLTELKEEGIDAQMIPWVEDKNN